MELKQRKLFSINNFLIRDNGLEWTKREKFHYQNTFFEFEELNFKKATKFKEYHLALIILSLFSLVGLLLTLFFSENLISDLPSVIVFFVLSLIFIGLTLFLRTDNIYIPTDRGFHIVMYNGLPTKQKFSTFLINLKSEARQSIINKYSGSRNVDQRKLYFFLEERGLIDENEKQIFEININPRTTVKGFGKN